MSTKYGLIQGKIKKYYGLNSELFSGLFEGHYGAGTAIVSVSPGTGSIHANILFKGIAKEGAQNTKFIVKFHTADDRLSVEESVILASVSSVSRESVQRTQLSGGVSRDYAHINAPQTCSLSGPGPDPDRWCCCHQSMKISDNPSLTNSDKWPFMLCSQGLSSVEVRTVFDEPELTALGKGSLLLSVWSAAAPSRRITANIVSRISCDIFDCVLQPQTDRQQRGHEAGIAYMYFTKDGGLKYNIK